MGALGLPPIIVCRLVLFITVMVGLNSAQNVERVEGPGNMTVVIGETTALRCTWEGSYSRYIFRIWEVLFKHRNNSLTCSRGRSMPTPRHTCIMESPRDPYHTTVELVISGVTLEDAGNYSCDVDEERLPLSEGEGPLSSAQGYLTVIVPPNGESPHCLINDPVSDHKVGADIQITCYSSGGVPPAQLSWYQGPNLVAGPSQGVLTYTRRITDSDDGLELNCLLNSSALRDTRNCSVIVDIPPEAEIQPSFLSIYSGSNVSFRCIGRFFQEVSQLYTWDLPNVSQSLDFDHQIQGDMMYLTNVRTTRGAEEFHLTCFVSETAGAGGRVWDTATLQIVSVKTTPVPASRSAPPNRSPSSGASTLVIVLCSCIPVVLIVIITCLLLLRMKAKHRRKANLPVTPRAGDDDQRDPGADYMGLSNTGRTDEPQRSAYQGLVPEYLDLTCPPDGDGTRPVSETVYEVTGFPEVVTASNQYETPVTVGTKGTEDELYVNHDVVKGKRQRGPRK
ncbi:cell adhesion molecule 4-like [Patiria miniata]|uniref:Ig-like domain-containing protein n=1 Tax=Patiria miniata TaxID=46514 RepID=A0A914BU31_PATMI|nr:cell adhesion molecule 4-like [Patiria miniata]